MIRQRLRNVPDSVCEDCGQCWQGQCRAYEMPHSEEERKHREKKKDLNCENRKSAGLLEKARKEQKAGKEQKAFELKLFRAGW